MDSLEGCNEIQRKYKEQLESIYTNVKVETVSILKQTDYTSCVAYTVENFF